MQTLKSQKIIARTFGIFFLFAFLSYGIGTGLTTSITEAEGSLSQVYTNRVPYIIGIILMALVHTIVNIGLPVLMQPILQLKQVSRLYLILLS